MVGHDGEVCSALFEGHQEVQSGGAHEFHRGKVSDQCCHLVVKQVLDDGIEDMSGCSVDATDDAKHHDTSNFSYRSGEQIADGHTAVLSLSRISTSQPESSEATQEIKGCWRTEF